MKREVIVLKRSMPDSNTVVDLGLRLWFDCAYYRQVVTTPTTGVLQDFKLVFVITVANTMNSIEHGYAFTLDHITVKSGDYNDNHK